MFTYPYLARFILQHSQLQNNHKFPNYFLPVPAVMETVAIIITTITTNRPVVCPHPHHPLPNECVSLVTVPDRVVPVVRAISQR